jgi:hypothetical protein
MCLCLINCEVSTLSLKQLDTVTTPFHSPESLDYNLLTFESRGPHLLIISLSLFSFTHFRLFRFVRLLRVIIDRFEASDQLRLKILNIEFASGGQW